jgi:hypothetical protein
MNEFVENWCGYNYIVQGFPTFSQLRTTNKPKRDFLADLFQRLKHLTGWEPLT